jgi:hypothetical protein
MNIQKSTFSQGITEARSYRPGLLPFRPTDAEKPPSIVHAWASGMPVEVDLQSAVSGGGHLEPVFANIQLGAAVAALSGFTPGAQNS